MKKKIISVSDYSKQYLIQIKRLFSSGQNSLRSLSFFAIAAFLFAILLLGGCDLADSTDDDETQQQFHVSEAEAAQVAENVLFPEEPARPEAPRQLTAGDFTLQKDVDSITPLENDEGENVMYIVNYHEEGFVVLSADKRVEPVLAYSATNEFEIRADIYNPGLVNWVMTTTEFIEDVRREEGEPGRHMMMIWDSFLDIPTDVYYLGVLEFCNEDGYAVMTGPLVETEWGQGCGYNDHLPDNSCPDDDHRCNRYPTGCVATAMAQIAKYWADLSGLEIFYEKDDGAVFHNWDAMPTQLHDEGESEEVARLMRNMGTLVDMDYGCDGSAAFSSAVFGPNAYDEFVDNFGFSNAKKRDLESASDYDRLIAEIEDYGRPVYMRGCDVMEPGFFLDSYDDCHAWIADGTSERINCLGDVIEGTFEVLMNWGWNGQQDGEFRIKGKGGDYEYDQSMIYDLF